MPDCSRNGITFIGANPPRSSGPSTKQPYSQTACGPWPGSWRRACHRNPSPLHQAARAALGPSNRAPVAQIEMFVVGFQGRDLQQMSTRKKTKTLAAMRRCRPGSTTGSGKGKQGSQTQRVVTPRVKLTLGLAAGLRAAVGPGQRPAAARSPRPPAPDCRRRGPASAGPSRLGQRNRRCCRQS